MAMQQRAEHANQLIEVIAAHGRKFFRCSRTGNVSHIEVDDSGRVWFHDYYSRARINTTQAPYGKRWVGFTSGGTLRSLVEDMRDYILTGQTLDRSLIGPIRTDGSNIWGYDVEAMDACRAECFLLPILDAE